MVSKFIASLFFLTIALSACQPEKPVEGEVDPYETQEMNVNPAANPVAAAPATEPNKTDAIKDAKLPETDGEWKKITLNGYSCGDNCYVEYTPSTKGGAAETALCAAKICGDWERAGVLPAAYKNKIVEVKFSTAKRVDGNSKVVDNFSSISEIRMAK